MNQGQARVEARRIIDKMYDAMRTAGAILPAQDKSPMFEAGVPAIADAIMRAFEEGKNAVANRKR